MMKFNFKYSFAILILLATIISLPQQSSALEVKDWFKKLSDIKGKTRTEAEAIIEKQTGKPITHRGYNIQDSVITYSLENKLILEVTYKSEKPGDPNADKKVTDYVISEFVN